MIKTHCPEARCICVPTISIMPNIFLMPLTKRIDGAFGHDIDLVQHYPLGIETAMNAESFQLRSRRGNEQKQIQKSMKHKCGNKVLIV